MTLRLCRICFNAAIADQFLCASCKAEGHEYSRMDATKPRRVRAQSKPRAAETYRLNGGGTPAPVRYGGPLLSRRPGKPYPYNSTKRGWTEGRP